MNVRVQLPTRSSATPISSVAPGQGGLLQRKCACGGNAGLTGECAACRKKRLGVQRKAVNHDAAASAPPVVHEVLRSPGRPLEPATRAAMESHLGHDFSDVRVHADTKAAASARAVNALAYTVGRDVVFGSGQFAPGSRQGQRLLAHELTHVLQQKAATFSRADSDLQIMPASDAYEREADRLADATLWQEPAKHLQRPFLQRQPAPAGQAQRCVPKHPEECVTYELWLHSFRQLPTFQSFDTAPRPRNLSDADVNRACQQQGAAPHPGCFDVLGGSRAALAPGASASQGPPPPRRTRTSDHFIDRPTDDWVKNNLPGELREMAYRLPADCADIAVILRHVWVFAHQRTESYRGWTIGLGAGVSLQQRARNIRRLIVQEVYSGNVERMVNPYADSSGRPIRSFATLSNLLHPGDVLVWEHRAGSQSGRRTGGHTQTIQSIRRDDANGRITQITALQGNQPIFAEQAQAIRSELQRHGRSAPSESTLRSAPGRRVERSILSGSELHDENNIWTQIDTTTVNGRQVQEFTVLLVAGPPAAAPQPRARRRARHTRRLSDWLSVLRSAGANLQAVFETALLEARAVIEGGGTVANSDARDLGETAGERLWNLARASVRRFAHGRRGGDLGQHSHFDRLHRFRAVILALGGIRPRPRPRPSTETPNAGRVRSTFRVIDDGFHLAARGASTIQFGTRARRGASLVKILLTGFDPFTERLDPATGAPLTPGPGVWNPSGAAVLALDNQPPIRAARHVDAAVEGVVLPVSFRAFTGGRSRRGIVERMVRPHAATVDAVITVSMAGMAANQPVQIEQFAVGVRDLIPLRAHRLFPAERRSPGGLRPTPAAAGGSAGEAIMESTADVARIARETRQPRRGRSTPGIPRPTIGTDVTFLFANRALANQALAALGTTASSTSARSNGTVEVTIDDVAALRQIISSMQRSRNRTRITFRAGRKTFSVGVLSGPGGDFLSNEVSFRVLRLLQQTGSSAVSFHVHTQRGEVIPQDTSTRAARRQRSQALARSRNLLSRLIITLKRIVKSVARIVDERRRSAAGGTP